VARWIRADLTGDWDVLTNYAQQFPVIHEKAIRRVLRGIGWTTKTELRKVIKSGNFPLTPFSIQVKKGKGQRTEPLRATDQMLNRIRTRMNPAGRFLSVFWERTDEPKNIAYLVEHGHTVTWTRPMVAKIMFILGVLPINGDKAKAATYFGFLRKKGLSIDSPPDAKGVTQLVKGRYFVRGMMNSPAYRQAVAKRMFKEYTTYVNPRWAQ